MYSWKRKEHFNSLFGESWIFFLHSTNGSFLKISCQMESETMLMNFLYSVTLKSTGLCWTFTGSFTHRWFCNIRCSLVFWKTLVHWIKDIFSLMAHNSLYYTKRWHLLISPLISSEKSLNIRKLKAQGDKYNFSKILVFILKFKSYHWQQILSVVINCSKWQSHFVHFWKKKKVCQIPKYE